MHICFTRLYIKFNTDFSNSVGIVTLHLDFPLIPNIFKFSSYEKVLVLCAKPLSEFSSNLYVLRPLESGKTFFTKVSVCIFFFVQGKEIMHLLTLCGIKFVKMGPFFVFLKKLYEQHFTNLENL